MADLSLPLFALTKSCNSRHSLSRGLEHYMYQTNSNRDHDLCQDSRGQGVELGCRRLGPAQGGLATALNRRHDRDPVFHIFLARMEKGERWRICPFLCLPSLSPFNCIVSLLEHDTYTCDLASPTYNHIPIKRELCSRIINCVEFQLRSFAIDS